MIRRIHRGCWAAAWLALCAAAWGQEPGAPGAAPSATLPDSVVATRQGQLLARLRAELDAAPAPGADPQPAQRRLDQIVADALQLVSVTGNERLKYEGLSMQLQALHLRITRWPADAGNERRLSELRAAGRRLKAVRQPQAMAAGDFWLIAAELFEIKQSDLSLRDKQRQSEQVLRSFLTVHNSGTAVEAARTALRQLIEQGTQEEALAPAPEGAGSSPPGESGEPAYSLGEPVIGSDGVVRVPLRTRYQRAEVALRILPPARSATGDPPAFLLVLPAEAGENGEFGDPLRALAATDAHNQHNLIIVCPTISDTPWYGDHPTDLKLRQASYITRAVAPAMKELYPQASPRVLLLGFSRSGWGALNLLCRFPRDFEAAAVWDAPVMLATPALPGMEQIFPHAEAFTKVSLAEQFRASAKVLRKQKRIALLGYDFFLDHLHRAHKLLEELGIPHDYLEQPGRHHHWESGWVADAVARLAAMAGP